MIWFELIIIKGREMMKAHWDVQFEILYNVDLRKAEFKYLSKVLRRKRISN